MSLFASNTLFNQLNTIHTKNENTRMEIGVKNKRVSFSNSSSIDNDVNFAIRSCRNDSSCLDVNVHLSEWYQHSKLPLVYLKRMLARRRRRIWMQYESMHILLQEDIHPRGLPNHGHTCYLNAILQAVLSPISFVVYLHRLRHVPVCECLFYLALYIHYDGEKQGTRGNRRRRNVPYLLKTIMKYVQKSGQFHFQLNEQHDAQELLHALMDCILEQSGMEHYTTTSTLASEGQQEEGEKEHHLLFRHFIHRMETMTSNAADMTRSENREQNNNNFSGILNQSPPNQNDKDTCEEGENSLLLQYNELKQKIPSIQRLIIDTSSCFPSPFSGRIQSTLECSACHHMRQSESTFLEIPIVPTELSRIGKTQKHESSVMSMENIFQICTLQDCLEEFVAEETIHEYDCLSCSLRLELKRLKEEEMLTRDAIMFQMQRKKHPDHADPDSEVFGLEHELNEILSRQRFLSTLDANGDDYQSHNNTTNAITNDTNKNDIQCHIHKYNNIPKPVKVTVMKRLRLLHLPPILCFHVKRLYYDTHLKRMNKSSQHIQLNEFLDVSCLSASDKGENLDTDDPYKYRLMSVVVHAGNAHSGHYFTYRRVNHMDVYRNIEDVQDGKTWVMVSDEDVTYASWSQVSRCEAYLLFYELF
jgi:ubiquitin C-terminal hydrolase